ncbi:hypothetical protein BUALT_Bualt03G0113400 [Buddleja alternifolia]|uniref:Glycosyltransferase 61 catalytic domain-containing protein n=1 Tax=Buddleja alternifolia TaxID=168488 RepID=A0AAV6Y3P0_9LAMI|nr:hypothetical protein BUALT_Bualt03G0113400 [Buddleja alternifolia]
MMEKEHKKLIVRATPILFLLAIPLLCVAVDFFWGNTVPFDRCEDLRNLENTGFACDKAIHSIHCVSNQPVRIDTRGNVTVYVPSDSERETVTRPYARQEDLPKTVSLIHILQYDINATIPPSCQYTHTIPAVIFSSGSIGNVFHEMNDIIIPLFITTKHFQSRVLFILEDYKPSFVAKYGKVLSHLSSYDILNPAANTSVHCFPGSIVGLKYHDNLALNSSEIPGGYAMPEFRHFLRQAYGLKFEHVSQINRPRLMLLSRTNTRRFLNEEEMVALMRELGFEVLIIRRSKVISNLNKFSQLINSCSVLVGAHGAGLTNEIFLPSGAVMVQVELLGTEWASNTYYGDTARAMDVRYLRYKIDAEESSLVKLYGRNHSVVTDPGSTYRDGGYRAARTVYLDQQNVRLNLVKFRETLVEALSIVTDFSSSETVLSSRKAMINKAVEEKQEPLDFPLSRLVKDEDQEKLKSTGFACNSEVYSLHCVTNRPVWIDTRTMTVTIPSNQPVQDKVIRPYARQEDKILLKSVTPVKILQGNTTTPFCQYNHEVPAVIFSSSGGRNRAKIPQPFSYQFQRNSKRAFNAPLARFSQRIIKPQIQPRVTDQNPDCNVLSRRTTRRIINEDEIVSMMEELGFRVIIVARAKVISNLELFASMINSCSVFVGAHGAGLTNEVFLPDGAVMVQVDLIGLEWAGATYYGNPARAMGVHYLRYKIEPEESSLMKIFGNRNHIAFTDPKGAFPVQAGKEVYLNGQNAKINVTRFRETMVVATSLVRDSEL